MLPILIVSDIALYVLKRDIKLPTNSNLPSVVSGADPGVQLVSPQVISHPPGGRLSLISARPALTFPAAEHHRPLAGTKLYCLVTEEHRCKQLAHGCYTAFAPSRFWTHDLLIASTTLYSLRHLQNVQSVINFFLSSILTECTSYDQTRHQYYSFTDIKKHLQSHTQPKYTILNFILRSQLIWSVIFCK